MNRPYKYLIIDKRDNSFTETNIEPYRFDPTQPEISKTLWVDARYEAKLRLYNYVSYTRKGLDVPKYQPYKNTNIGKTEPILNF